MDRGGGSCPCFIESVDIDQRPIPEDAGLGAALDTSGNQIEENGAELLGQAADGSASVAGFTSPA